MRFLNPKNMWLDLCFLNACFNVQFRNLSLFYKRQHEKFQNSRQLFILSSGGALLAFRRHRRSRKRHSEVCNGGDVPATINNTGCDPRARLLPRRFHCCFVRDVATRRKYKSRIGPVASAVIRGSHTEPLPATVASLS